MSGASAWTDEQRVIFAQDLSRPELVAVAGSVNFAENHAGIETWSLVPERRCDYAKAWVTVKAADRLTVTEPERDAITAMLATCA